MRKFIFLIIAILFSNMNFTKAQTFMPGIPRVSIDKDSIFEQFVPPNIPAFLYESVGDFKDMYINSLDIICNVGVDQNQKVKYLYAQPLYGYNNDLRDTSFIWKYVLNSLDSVSKLWIFKPILYNIEDRYSEELKIYYSRINEKILEGKNPRGRWKNGNQWHIIYINIRMPYLDEDVPDFIYFLKVNN